MRVLTDFKGELSKLSDFNDSFYEGSWKWKLLQELYEKNWKKKKGKSLIPKIIHQVWVGGTPFPKKYQWWADTWKKYNPEYEYILWTDEKVKELNIPNKTLYDQVHVGAKSDILRYHLLDTFGGIYIDTDFECFKSFDDLSDLEFYGGVAYPHNNWERVEIYSCLIGSVPGHPIIKEIMKGVEKLTYSEFKLKGVFETLTSWYFTRIFFEVVKEYKPGIVMTPPSVFYSFPNHKLCYKDHGRKYLQDHSYAIHHWEVSWTTNSKKNVREFDWIQGEKFYQLADFNFAPNKRAGDDWAKWPATFDPEQLIKSRPNFVYCTIMYLGRLLRIVESLPSYQFVILAHNADEHIDQDGIGTYQNAKCVSKEPYEIPDNVIKLYAPNLNAVHPKLDILPVGLENSMWPGNKREVLTRIRQSPSILKKTGLVYMNHAMNTNPEERSFVTNLFKHIPWVTKGVYRGNRRGYEEYYSDIASHKFILNPMGNCYDNHRMWEAWYLGCIPISKRSICISYFTMLPHVIIDDWKQITPEFLNSEYERIQNTKWDMDALTFSYWRTKVNSIR